VSRKNSKPSFTKSSTRRTGTKPKSGSNKSPAIKRVSSGGSGTVKPNWTTKVLNRNVFHVNVPLQTNKEWEWWLLISSDRHWDSPKSNLILQKKHLDEALERGAAILDMGDVLDLMGGKFDKRSHKEGIRPEHQVDDYFDAVIADAGDFLAPYAKNFIAIATGNHESAMFRHEINPVDRLVYHMNHTTGARVNNGGFSGWVVFTFQRPGSGDRRDRLVLHYDHGYGGGGPVTHDAIAHQRRSVYLPDANIIASGHTHDRWVKEVARLRLLQNGNVRQDLQVHIKCPSYKNDYGDGFNGWAATVGHPPKPIGAWWVRFFFNRSEQRVDFEVIKAQ
jgi:hypothetical protein